MISATAYHAVRIATCIAQQQGKRVTISALAERTGLSNKFVEHILAKLRAAGLVRSFKGRFGGYTSARPGITVGDVVRAVDEPHSRSEDARDEAAEAAFELVREAMWKVVDGLTLEGIVE
jgi:Rrf2 family protein